MATTDLVSIVVPIYNLGDYLTATLQSIAKQSYQNLEVLLVNDHSDDQSLRVAKKWQQQDARFQVFDLKTHQGVSRARNVGLENATGRFLSFVDGDDQLEPSFIADLVAAIQQPNVGLAAVGYNWGSYWEATRTTTRSYRLSRREMYQVINRHGDEIGGYIWNKLFITAEIKSQQLKFDESLKLAEDLLFTAEYVAHVKEPQTAFDPAILYQKINRRNSIIHSATYQMRATEQVVREKIDRLGQTLTD